MFILKIDDTQENIKKIVDLIEKTTNDKGIVIPLNSELYLKAPLSELFKIQHEIDKEIAIRKCCNYDINKK